MATPSTETLAVTCPSCAAHFQVSAEMAGRKGRCARCNAVFRVPEQIPVAAPIARKHEPAPQYISVLCRVCQTLMYGRLDQVGQPLKCPDCYAQTIVPQPQPAKPTKPLAAMEGDQYELWGVDESPTVAEMLKAQPKYIAVECRLCRTLMHATEDQVGKKLKCPDCGTANLVSSPEAPAKKPSVLARDEDDLLIDPTRDPGERPQVIIPPRAPMVYEVEAEAARKLQEERQARGDKHGPQYDAKGRAVMPRWPLATRIFPFLVSNGVPARWLTLSAVAYLALFFLWLGSLVGHPLAAVPMAVMALITMTIWLAGLAAIVMSIIVESSEGNDEVQNWPTTNPSDWVGEFFYLLFACISSPLPGWLFGRLLIVDPAARIPWFVGSLFLSLPVIILSQLDVGSAFAIASPRVIASFLRVPGTWLMFYVEIAMLMAAAIGVTIVAASLHPFLAILLVPLYIAAILLAVRILGRLAWKLAETMPAKE